MESNRILIVDDSPMIHSIIKRALEPNGFVVCGCAKNGKQGIEQFNELNPDLITMDITMPIMDGLCASREIMNINPNANILMLSAMGDEEVMSEAKGIGVKHFLKKPFKEDEMLEAVRNILKG
ncbi:response regulator [Clostridium cylindrosporum]|uniref:Stage 0 sporulation protein A homolog n=1 Tax=Clostridium cylindrosporum DSM 605 TaxID=1121307 RepID=A0A0J8DCM9_CLOCY|nr:response regulator [Clostridium cylindrosporum]KMT22009.1 chemotaxis protein CheY [Clostridium cylindrosporum DSM 605]